MEKINSFDFIGVLSNTLPSVVLFSLKDDKLNKLKKDLDSIKSNLTKLPLYEMIIDENEKNEELAEYLGIEQTPFLAVFKDGSFNRYKDKNFTLTTIKKFIGGQKIYS